jgi:hypothetical protein
MRSRRRAAPVALQLTNGVMESTAGMYGELQGIAGQSLLEVDGLSVPMLENGAKASS